MILSQPDIRKAVQERAIISDPALAEDQWGEASVDLRLGFSFTILSKIPGMKLSVADGLRGIAKAGFWRTRELRESDELASPLPAELAYGSRETDVYQDQRHPLGS